MGQHPNNPHGGPRGKLFWGLMAAYAATHSLHFAINAELIPFYPYMPQWVRPGTVYAAWLAVNALGLLGVVLHGLGHRRWACAALALYGLLGLDGLLHYALDLCVEHGTLTNIAIAATALTGLAFTGASVWAYANKSGALRPRITRVRVYSLRPAPPSPRP